MEAKQVESYILKGQRIAQMHQRVVQKDLYDNVIREFSSANEASRILNIHNSHIVDCCNQKVRKDSDGHLYTVKSAGGFKFSWVNN